MRRNGKACLHSATGVLLPRIRQNCVVILEDGECEEVGEVESTLNISTFGTEYEVNIHVMEKITKKAEMQQKRATVMVNSGALTFILLAAALVTTSLLMSPVIEQIFGKRDYCTL